ncbi:hypothetical protein D9757_010715 [Collybiopsis confluens]|uniref:Uncharacterized protein n=1 Tax=Collybiopsis confluens TaxID=2823264 RepID=A0A8H5H004_9AGAR|nr:hypothetical protein D9757_010715 [Collybiopsis confluens]
MLVVFIIFFSPSVLLIHYIIIMTKDLYGIDIYSRIRRVFHYSLSGTTLVQSKIKTTFGIDNGDSVKSWFWPILSLVLALIAAGGGWSRNPSMTVNMSGVGNAVVSFFSSRRVFTEKNHHEVQGVAGLAGLESRNNPGDSGYEPASHSRLIRLIQKARRKGTPAQWILSILSVILGAISAGGGWKNNSAMVNVCAIGAAVVPVGTFLFGTNQPVEFR